MTYGYIRVSTDKQDTENQKLGINEKALKLGLTIEDWISDDGISGTKEPEERKLGKLLEKIKENDIIIVSELSRLGRKLFMIMRILEHCMKIGAKVYTVKEGYELGDNIQSKVMAFAFGLSAEIERNMISERTTEALKQRRALGVILGSPRSKRKTKKITDDVLDLIIKDVEGGMAITTAADKYKFHRITIAYYLSLCGKFKGKLAGYKITYCNGKEFLMTKRNAREAGLYYKHIQDAYLENKDLSNIGISKIEPQYQPITQEVKDYYVTSEHPKIDRSIISSYVEQSMTIPEIHKMFPSVSYDEVYDYIADDTMLSMEYREKGQKRIRKPRE